MYSRFGKVKQIDASKGVNEVFEQTKKAMLPEIFFIIGQKGSGKSTLAKELAYRTNMEVLSFDKFIKESGFNPNSYDDEEVTMALIKRLINETSPRVLLEDFPRSEKQARLFIKNCVAPSEVFYIKCSKDICQERLLDIGSDHPKYVPSAILAKQVKRFHENSGTLIPYLAANTRFNEINGEHPLPHVLKEVFTVVEPTIIHVRTGGNTTTELRK